MDNSRTFPLFLSCVALLLSSGSALKCNMCNTLMEMNGVTSIVGDCQTAAGDQGYHPMECRNANSADYCMRWRGAYSIENSKNELQPKSFTGIHRDCGSVNNIAMYLGEDIPANVEVYCKKVTRPNEPVKGIRNEGATFSFDGEVCFCKNEMCNDNRDFNGSQALSSVFVATFLIALVVLFVRQ